jgi:TRAP-type uncharacterized transport system substrate-binding protein
MSDTVRPSPARSRGAGWLVLALGLAALATALGLGLRHQRRPASRVTLSAGLGDTTRDRVARLLASELRARGFDAEVLADPGNSSELQAVDSGAVDFALVSSAYRAQPYAHVREVTPLYVEALHLLVKRELAGRAIGTNLAGLRGLRVDLGPAGSTTAELAAAVLAFAELSTSEGSGGRPGLLVRHLELPELEALIGHGDASGLPDAVFHLATVPSVLALRLVRERDYELVPLPFAHAFRLGSILAERASHGEAGSVERTHATDVTIPPFTYQIEPPVPSEAAPTLGARLLLVANERVSPETVEGVLDAVFGSHFAHVSEPPLARSLLALPMRLPRHSGTRLFQARQKPILTEHDVEELSNTMSVAGALLGGGLFLWQAWRQQRQARRDRVFAGAMRRVAELERRVVELELSASMELEPLIEVQRALLQLKSETLDRFASGELGDQAALSDLLAPVNAARDHVGSLLLHVRENLEERAESEGKTVHALWSEVAEGPQSDAATPPEADPEG